MILYHGSTDLVRCPQIRQSETFLDFGNGFYTTSSYEQAERWARIKMRRLQKEIGYVAKYSFDTEAAMQDTAIVRYESADLSWLQFVVGCRRGVCPGDAADMHIGPVADDNVYRSIRLFETGILDAEETVRRLKTEQLHDQWTFHTEKILSYLTFLDAVEVRREVI